VIPRYCLESDAILAGSSAAVARFLTDQAIKLQVLLAAQACSIIKRWSAAHANGPESAQSEIQIGAKAGLCNPLGAQTAAAVRQMNCMGLQGVLKR